MNGGAQRAVAHILERADWSYSRSSGPGGQRRDHAETRAELTVRCADLDGLPARVAERLRTGLRLEERPLRLRCGTERSREQNRTLVEERLRRRVAAALAPPPPPRRPTRPGAAAVERRLAAKSRRTATKQGRRPPGADD